MRILILLIAGAVFIKNRQKIKDVVVQASTDAAKKFDDVYSGAAKNIGQTFESIDDKLAERNRSKVKESESDLNSTKTD